MGAIKIDESYFEKLDAEIRAGNLNLVKHDLEKLDGQKISRNFLIKIANLARRAGYQRFALRLLHPVVRAEKPVSPAATPEEKIEYAVCLMRMGVVSEAEGILESIDQDKFSEVLLYRAFCLFNRWEHQSAIPLLDKYLQSSVSDYQKLVAKTNLLMAHTILLNFKEGKKVFEEIVKGADVNTQKLLVGYSHQLFAELCITQKMKEPAKHHLEKAKELLRDANYRYALHSEQLEATLKLLSPNEVSEGKKLLSVVRKNASQKKLWEVLRDCDFYECVFTKNNELAQKLYFGTPFENFRKRLINLYGEISFDESYVWYPQEKSEHVLDVDSATDLRSGEQIRSGQLLHKLLAVLASDFYRPFKLQSLFGLLFPDEYYSTSSSHKIYDLIGRLEKWFNENNIPIDVFSYRGEYFLKVKEPYGIRVKPFAGVSGTQDKFVEELQNKFGDKLFSTGDVIEILGLSRSSAKRYLREALEAGVLKTTGAGKYLKYHF